MNRRYAKSVRVVSCVLSIWLLAPVSVSHATEATPPQDEAVMKRDDLEESVAQQGPGLAHEIGPVRLEAHGQS
ncbi:MAG: hypothetical protein ABW205_07075, partial [Burkholderiales bacterium]